ncbi:helix-hairpin-helix domain-containing protein [Streptomyces xinghaiensis]|uniref:helix-hairpin-helix domain-containing protein n=1 Tax=Streptomyces xinghaiensis TaxID=1038928 RepID=UPI001EDCC1A5|nr:helix-hairpin-helix domain-containing protein [Streptomyces xinghaiensis]
MTTDRPAGETAAAAPAPEEAPAPAGTPAPAPAPPAGEGTARPSPSAEALAAAVRAVESGERPASAFFSEPRPAARPSAAAAQPGSAAGSGPASGSGGSGPVPRPESSGGGPVPGAAAVPGARPPSAERAARSATVREVLAAGGAPETLAEPVADLLGERAADVLREDPWQLLAVPGVQPEQADGFARALLGPEAGPGDERRAQALTAWLLERAALRGHTALEPSALSEALARQAVPDPEAALHEAIAGGAVLVFQDALDAPGPAGPGAAPRPMGAPEGEEAEQPVRVLLGLDRYALAEESLADGLGRIAGGFGPDGTPGSGPDAAAWEAAAEAAPSPSAAELIRAAAGHGLVAHTGGETARAEPLALVAAARALGLRAWAAVHSPAGCRRAAAPLTASAAPDATERPEGLERPDAAVGAAGGEDADGAVVTVAGLLAGGEGPGRDPEGALELDLLVVLDAPQLDVETAAMLAESLPDGARLVLSGDPGVLWSAGPGKVFADLLSSGFCPRVTSRTPDPGPIGELVSAIGVGELPSVEAPGKEVVIVPVRDAGEAVHRTVQLVADSVPRAIGVSPEQTQVITPGHAGAAGTRALNAALKERLNPGPGRFGGFDPGDRVVYTPAPGRALTGTVVSADAEGLRLEGDGGRMTVPRERVAAGAVRHGWALTAHQAAGTTWPAAVVVLPGDAARALTRAWVYTAFGRAERHLSVVHGVEQALPRAVAEVPVTERTTRLRTLLRALTPPPAQG